MGYTHGGDGVMKIVSDRSPAVSFRSQLVYYALLFCVGITSICFAPIYEIHVLKKWNPQTRNFNYFIALSDFHDKSHNANTSQHVQLEDIIARCNKQLTKIILEDLGSCASNGRNSCGSFVINSQGGILGGLANRYSNRGLHVDNVEYRYCRVASLGPVINNIENTSMPFQSTNAISVGVLLQEIEDSIKEIKAFNDGPAFNGLYQKIVREVKAEVAKLKLHEARSNSVAHYMTQCSTPTNRLDILNKLLTVDSTLLDTKVIHSVVHAPETTIIAIAGGSHMVRVCNWLIKYGGYQHVYATPVTYGREYNLVNCVGAHIMQGNYCMRPEPIDLSVVTRYLK